MNRGFLSTDPEDWDALLAKLSDSLEGYLEGLAAVLGEESINDPDYSERYSGASPLVKAQLGIERLDGNNVDEYVSGMVDRGFDHCNCGRPSCPLGKKFQAEVSRRKGNGKGQQQNTVVSDYMLLQRQLVTDVTKAVETGVAKGGAQAIQEFLSKEPDDDEAAQKRLAAIIAAGTEAAIVSIWHSSPIYKFVWLPIKLIFVILAILVTAVLTPVFHLVVAIPGFLYAVLRRESVRNSGVEMIKRKLIKVTKDFPEPLRITREDLRRHGDRLREDALKLLPFYLRWGVSVGDYFANRPRRWRWQNSRFHTWFESRRNPAPAVPADPKP